MDEGLFFWLIIVAVAVLQGIGQKKRKPGKPGQRLPRSKPDGQQASTLPRPRETGPGEGAPDLTSDEGASSESMIPSDVWEEILGLARGKSPGRPPKRDPSEEREQPLPMEMGGMAPEEMEGRGAREVEVRPARGMETRQPTTAPAGRTMPTSHGAEATHHATKPSESESRLGVPRQSVVLGLEGRGASVRRELFGGGTLMELRKAIVHQEVLGKPVSLKDDS